jgi:hypothetical protein
MTNVKKRVPLLAIAACLLLLTVVSSHTAAAASPSLLTAASEASVQGGLLDCSSVLGLSAGLAIGMFSPCSIICATASFYALVAAGFMGC